MEEKKKALPAAGLDCCAQNLPKTGPAGAAESAVPSPAAGEDRRPEGPPAGAGTAAGPDVSGTGAPLRAPSPSAPQPCARPAGQREPFPADRRDRRTLLGALGVCILAADLFWSFPPGAGVTAVVWGWYALVLAYLGPRCLRRGECRFLLGANLLLAASFSMTSDWYFRVWNLLALLALVPVHIFALSGAAFRPWSQPAMLGERLWLTLEGAFGSLGAVGPALTGAGKNRARAWTAVLGTALAAALVLALLPVLTSADALFASVTAAFRQFLREHLTQWVCKVLLGLALTPFLFSLLYTLRYPRKENHRPSRPRSAEALLFLILLAALDGLYLLFLAVQAAGLFGGAAYLHSRGISYADWARSGFFQMTGVTVVNLLAVLGAVTWSRRGGREFAAVRVLGTLLAAESLVLLASAVWRMGLYVGAYGLSFQRAMTFWGMAMMAFFLAIAAVRIWREHFSFCRAAFPVAVAAWVAVSFVPIDALVARDNVARYCSGRSQAVDCGYLLYDLSYDALPALADLDGSQLIWPAEGGETLAQGLAERRAQARAECAHWESWNLSAYLASRDAPGENGAG
jgi:hypothetical protein